MDGVARLRMRRATTISHVQGGEMRRGPRGATSPLVDGPGVPRKDQPNPPDPVSCKRKEVPVGARQRLNSGYLQGSAVVAALMGLVFSSWFVFAAAFAVMVLGNLLAGDIRPRKPNS